MGVVSLQVDIPVFNKFVTNVESYYHRANLAHVYLFAVLVLDFGFTYCLTSSLWILSFRGRSNVFQTVFENCMTLGITVSALAFN